MQTNMMGEFRPANLEEIKEAFMLTENDPMQCTAMVEEETENDGFGGTGWTAEIRDSSDGEHVFATLAYDEKDALTKDLSWAGMMTADIHFAE